MENSEWFLLGEDTRLWGITRSPVLLLVNNRFFYKGFSVLYEHEDVLHRGSPADTSTNMLHCPRIHKGNTTRKLSQAKQLTQTCSRFMFQSVALPRNILQLLVANSIEKQHIHLKTSNQPVSHAPPLPSG